MNKVRIAIIGTGGISFAHGLGMLAHPDVIECVALCDISDASLQERSEQLGGVSHRFHDWRTMLSEVGDQFDAVVICLPHHLHSAAILDALAAGKHVLCEKPMCIDLEDAARIVSAVGDSGLVYMSAHNQLFFPAVQKARELLDEGFIGKLRWVRTQDCRDIRSQFGETWRGNRELLGGGVLMDSGYHPTYLLLYFADSRVAGIRGNFARFTQKIEGEDTASVQVRFESGMLGDILTAWGLPLPFGTFQFHLIGDKGQLFGSDDTLYFLPAGFKEPARLETPSPGSLGSTWAQSFASQMARFVECIRGSQRPIHGAEEGYATLEIILKSTANAEGWQETAHLKV